MHLSKVWYLWNFYKIYNKKCCGHQRKEGDERALGRPSRVGGPRVRTLAWNEYFHVMLCDGIYRAATLDVTQEMERN